MPISVRDLGAQAVATLGNRESKEYPLLDLVNEWGDAFFTLHPWSFNVRAPASLNFVAGQDFAGLPADFGQLEGKVQITSGLIRSMIPSTMEQITSLRTSSASPVINGVYYYAIEYPVPVPSTGQLGNARLALFDTPQQNITSALTVPYRAGWPELVSDNEFCPIPKWARACFIQGWRHYLRGLEEEDTSPMAARFALWMSDPLTIAAMEHDGGVQGNIGPQMGGAVTLDYGFSRDYDGPVAGP